MNPIFLEDFYKIGHVQQYPEGTTQVFSNWTARSTRVKEHNGIVFFGLQYFIKEILIELWSDFFLTPLPEVLAEYRHVIRNTLGVQNPKTDHIENLHKLGYLPLDIWALPEGDTVPLRVPALVITNTEPSAYWLPNFLETILSNILWKPCTSATTAQAFRRIFTKYAIEAGERDLTFVNWQGHDFSFRGMSGREDMMLSGMGHLLSFNGTDTIPAILGAQQYYSAVIDGMACGGSVPATEHSVMCAGSKEGEQETFRRLIEDVYPTGIVSIVSDTWDLWKVLTEIVPALKDKILARDGKVVIRPDSGDPVNILCGDPDKGPGSPAGYGTLRLLEATLGSSPGGGNLPMINKAGAIYGDSINLERADAILSRTVRELKLSPYNVVLGIGSYTYEFVTRDTYGFAMKATAVRQNGEIVNIYKKPITDTNKEKASLTGIPCVHKDAYGQYFVQDNQQPEMLDNCAFHKVFHNGELLVDQTFDEIRKRVRRGTENFEPEPISKAVKA